MAGFGSGNTPTRILSKNIYLTAGKTTHWTASHVHCLWNFIHLLKSTCSHCRSLWFIVNVYHRKRFTFIGQLLTKLANISGLWERDIWIQLILHDQKWFQKSMWRSRAIQSFPIKYILEILPVLRPWAIKPHPDSKATLKVQLQPLLLQKFQY